MDSETRAPMFIGVVIAMTAISTLFIGLRLYTRWVILRLVLLEDFIISAAGVWLHPSTFQHQNVIEIHPGLIA